MNYYKISEYIKTKLLYYFLALMNSTKICCLCNLCTPEIFFAFDFFPVNNCYTKTPI